MWIFEFLHVLIGILWIGLLYFFNLVQVQSMPKMTEQGAAKPYTQIILPRALFFFRHAALWTVISGIAYYVAGRGTIEGIPSPEIMIGMLLGIIMAGNVWFIIWPNQKKIIAGELEGFWKCMDTMRDKILLNKLWKEGKALWKKDRKSVV